MTIYDTLDGSQPDAGARKIHLRMQALEGLKERARMGHIETRAVIPDKQDGARFARLHSKLDSCLRCS